MAESSDRRMGLNDADVFGDESQAWGMEKDLDWRLAWHRAVAKAWALPEYKQRLLENPALALREVGWEVPKGLELKVELAGDGVRWDVSVHERTVDPDRAGGHIAANGWASKLEKDGALSDRREEVLKALKTTMIMRLPPAPEGDRFLALAMADYDGLSRAYPLTCAIC